MVNEKHNSLDTYIVGIMGRVDSGKTSFIEQLTNFNIVKKEAGKITQKLTIYELSAKELLEYLTNFEN